MRLYFLKSLLFIAKISFSQGYNLDSLFKVFQKDIDTEQDFNNGRIVFDDDTKENYYLLMEHSPIETILRFMQNSNPAIRCFMFNGIMNKSENDTIINKVINNHLNDTASFNYSSSDVVTNWKVIEWMLLYLKKKDHKIDYNKYIYNIKKYPSVTLQGERHGVINKESLLNIDSVLFNNNNYSVLSFSIMFKNKSKLYILKSKSNFFTSAMKRQIKKLKSGDRFSIEEINTKFPDGSNGKVANKNLMIH